MQILYDLIQSLAKEEKRLYNLNKRSGRFLRIYEGYLKAPTFSKALDQQIYNEHFSDVSRAFYSMQKRTLMDDVLVVLLEYSNGQNPNYEFTRLYSRANVLLQRKMGEAARAYGEEALAVAQKLSRPAEAELAVRLQRKAIVLSKNNSLQAYEKLAQLELDFHDQQKPELLVESVLHSLSLLQGNEDQASADVVRAKAEQQYQRLQAVKLGGPLTPLVLEKLRCEQAYYSLIDNYEQYHRMLIQVYKAAAKEESSQGVYYYQLTNMVLRSCLQCGDFLQLTGLIYKLSKDVNGLTDEVKEVFMLDYYELSALHYFYENDLPTALRQMLSAINSETASRQQIIRCIVYRQSMLLAAHLPRQALEELKHYRGQYPELQEHPLIWLMEVMMYMDMNADMGETQLLIERHKLNLKRLKDNEGRPVMDCLNQLGIYLEKKKVKERSLQVFPRAWEPIMRADLWLKAKQNNRFYYNLMLDDWQGRRRVY